VGCLLRKYTWVLILLSLLGCDSFWCWCPHVWCVECIELLIAGLLCMCRSNGLLTMKQSSLPVALTGGCMSGIWGIQLLVAGCCNCPHYYSETYSPTLSWAPPPTLSHMVSAKVVCTLQTFRDGILPSQLSVNVANSRSWHVNKIWRQSVISGEGLRQCTQSATLSTALTK